MHVIWSKKEWKVVNFVNFVLSHIRAFIYMGSNMTSLVHVNFESCMISDDGLLAIAKGCPYLQSIDISWCKMLSSAGLVQFASLSAGVKHLSCRFLSNVNRKYYINTIGMVLHVFWFATSRLILFCVLLRLTIRWSRNCPSTVWTLSILTWPDAR